MHDRRWHLDRNRVNVQVREDALYIGAVVARHLELRLDRVDGTFLRITRVCRAAHHDREDLLHADMGVERVERADESRRVARGHADERRAEAVRVIRGRIKGQVRQGVLLAPLPNRLHARLLVEGFVAALLRGAIDDEIRVSHEIVEDARGLHARLLEFRERLFV